MQKAGRLFGRWWEHLLISVLGCFSVFIIVKYSEIPQGLQGRMTIFQGVIAVALLFNVLWMSLRFFYRKMRGASPRLYLLAAFEILAVNYFLIVGYKYLSGSEHIFLLRKPGLVTLGLVWSVEITVMAMMIVIHSYKERERLFRKNRELEDSIAKRQYMALQSQLNPHFLFNTLNTLISEIECNPEGAADFARRMSDVYRYVMQCQERRLVPLEQELEFFRSYVYLHQVRLGDCLGVEIRIPDSLYDAEIPPLTLQLLAENIVKHNVISGLHPMKIEIYEEDGYLCVSNPVMQKMGVQSTGTGLANLRERYKILGGNEPVVVKEDMRFTVKVPLFYE